MVAFYVAKIENGEINSKTGKPWNVEDVPKLWRKKVQETLRTE